MKVGADGEESLKHADVVLHHILRMAYPPPMSSDALGSAFGMPSSRGGIGRPLYKPAVVGIQIGSDSPHHSA